MNMSEQVFMPVKTVRNYKVTVVEQAYKTHDSTNAVTEDIETVILDEEVYQATSQELAVFQALTQLATVGDCDMTNLKVSAHPF
jgi:hypothetical protein